MPKRNKVKYNSYSEIPDKKKDEIVRRSIREANKEQRELIREYDRKYRHAN